MRRGATLASFVLVACGGAASLQDTGGSSEVGVDDADSVDASDEADAPDATSVSDAASPSDAAADAGSDGDGSLDATVDAAVDASAVSCAAYGPGGTQVAPATITKIQGWQVDARLALGERPYGLVVSPTSVIYAATDAMVALDRATLTEKARTPADFAVDLAVVDNTLYAEEGFTSQILTFDMTTLAPGPSVTPALPPVSRASKIAAIADDPTNLYWSTSNSTGSSSEAHVIDLATKADQSYPFPAGLRGATGGRAFVDPTTGHRLFALGASRPGASLLVFDVEQRLYTHITPMALATASAAVSGIEPSGDGCRLYVGMFQDNDNLQIVDPGMGYSVVQKVSSPRRVGNPFTWANTNSLALYGDLLLVLNDANGELAIFNRFTAQILRVIPVFFATPPTNMWPIMDSGRNALRVVDGRILISNGRGKELIVINAPLQ